MSEPVIQISDLTRRFGSKAALDSVSLSLPRGAVYEPAGDREQLASLRDEWRLAVRRALLT